MDLCEPFLIGAAHEATGSLKRAMCSLQRGTVFATATSYVRYSDITRSLQRGQSDFQRS